MLLRSSVIQSTCHCWVLP